MGVGVGLVPVPSSCTSVVASSRSLQVIVSVAVFMPEEEGSKVSTSVRIEPGGNAEVSLG